MYFFTFTYLGCSDGNHSTLKIEAQPYRSRLKVTHNIGFAMSFEEKKTKDISQQELDHRVYSHRWVTCNVTPLGTLEETLNCRSRASVMKTSDSRNGIPWPFNYKLVLKIQLW